MLKSILTTRIECTAKHENKASYNMLQHETCLYNELSNYFEDIFSDYQFGFRKGISAQQCLIILIETWKNTLIIKSHLGHY